MIRSMTGYGMACAETPVKKITVELRALNSKQIDINTRIPWYYKEKEIEIRSKISQGLVRGKTDLSIFVDTMDEQDLPKLNQAAIKNYYRQLTDLAGEMNIENNKDLLSTIMRLPETLKTDKQTLSDEEWELISSLLDTAIGELDKYRIEEGKAIRKDLRERIRLIESCMKEILPFEEERINTIREKIYNKLRVLGNENIDQNRFEQEVLYYLEKLDINEEKVRLHKHCEYFIDTMESEDVNGKKLAFISQEIGREINTLGSKANHAGIQKIVVMMKDELEKVKEQILNIL
ncbi:MAG: YicC family protein [Bacteroidales bacterium]|nr:YicC family protein [Bacteroidales bacterium]